MFMVAFTSLPSSQGYFQEEKKEVSFLFTLTLSQGSIDEC